MLNYGGFYTFGFTGGAVYCKVTIRVHGKLLVLIAYSYAICLICLDVDKWLPVVRL